MRRLILTFLTLILFGWALDSVAQTKDKDNSNYSNNTTSNPDKEPHIDENGNRIPWYLPLPDDGQTRSTVDMSFAPAEMKMVRPSPAAASATKYADYSVSYGLGLANISIPLYEVKSHSLTLPISLSYDSGGIRVDDVSGPAGLGWTLEAGGVITRTIVGLDDNSSVGWQYRPDGDPVSSSFQNELYLRGVTKGEQDTGSDFYSYSFCGHSGSFYIDRKTTPWTVLPTTATDLEIKASVGGFTITDTDGTAYHFTEQETSLRYTSVTIPFPGGSGESYPQSTVPITAWYLSEILAMDGTDVIKFYYTTYGSLWTSRHANTRTYQFTYRYYSPGNYLWYSNAHQWSGYPDVSEQTGSYVTETSWTPKYLDHITFAGGRVDFEYTQNTGLTTQRRSYPWILDYISVKALPPATTSATEVFRASFTLPFQNLDKRNLLTGVTLTGRGGTPIETYTLTYISAGTNMDTNSKDLFRLLQRSE